MKVVQGVQILQTCYPTVLEGLPPPRTLETEDMAAAAPPGKFFTFIVYRCPWFHNDADANMIEKLSQSRPLGHHPEPLRILPFTVTLTGICGPRCRYPQMSPPERGVTSVGTECFCSMGSTRLVCISSHGLCSTMLNRSYISSPVRLPLYHPSPVDVGAVGYQSGRDNKGLGYGHFVTLFNSFRPPGQLQLPPLTGKVRTDETLDQLSTEQWQKQDPQDGLEEEFL